MSKLTSFLGALATLSMVAAAQAGPTNMGFETANLSGWAAGLSGGGTATVVQQLYGVDASGNRQSAGYDYRPQGGNWFLAIGSGAANTAQTVSQTFSLQAGQTVSGRAAFDWGESSQFDGASVEIYDASNTLVSTAFSSNGSGQSAGYDGAWTNWSFQAATSGAYTLKFSTFNTGDALGTSYGYFDVSAVPEPGSLALVSLALAGVVLVRRRQRA